jgi:hypothetical protein
MSTSAAQVTYGNEPISHGSSYGAPQTPPAPQFSVVTADPESKPDAGERGQEIWKMANQLYQQNPDWVTFFREVLGLNGYVRQPCSSFEPTRVITVRLPKSLHESLRAEAHEKRTSMNKLCISKLLQFIDTDLVPTET